MLNKKAAIAPETLVKIAAALVLVVSLFVVTRLGAEVITTGVEDKLCFLSAGISSVTKVGPTNLNDLHCKRKTVKVMMNSKDAPKQSEQESVKYVYINKEISKDLRKRLAEWYNEPQSNFDIKQNKERVLRYRLNEVMAKELKRCWGELGSGTLDLFSQDLLPANYGGAFKEGGSIANYLKLWNLKLREAPKICHICSMIIFHEDVQIFFKGDTMDLDSDKGSFLRNNPVKLATREAPSYYEYLQDDANEDDIFGIEYKYSTDEKMAVIFLRMNLRSYVGEQWARFSITELSEIFSDRDYKEDGTVLAVDMPLLIPFDEVSANCDKYA